MRRCLAVLALACLCRGGDAPAVEVLIERLGHDDAFERDAATEGLVRLLGRAEAALTTAAREHADPEVRRRARFILERIRARWPKVIEPTPGRRIELSDAPQNGLARLCLSSEAPGDAWIEYELALWRRAQCCSEAKGTVPARGGGETSRFGPLLPGDQVQVRARFLDKDRKVRHVAVVEHEERKD